MGLSSSTALQEVGENWVSGFVLYWYHIMLPTPLSMSGLYTMSLYAKGHSMLLLLSGDRKMGLNRPNLYSHQFLVGFVVVMGTCVTEVVFAAAMQTFYYPY